jgi:hypothetical protein
MLTLETAVRSGDVACVGRPAPEGFSTRFGDYGCRLNALRPEDLLARYEQGRFLYPAKRQRLEPIWDQVLDTWHRLGRAGAVLAWVIDKQDEAGGWASVMSWRSTNGGWVSQHLVSTGGPTLSRAVLLAACAFHLADGRTGSHQNWFRHENRFADAVFGTFASAVGPALATNVEHQLLELPADRPLEPAAAWTVTRVAPNDHGAADATAFIRRVRGEVYIVAEQLDGPDLELQAVGDLYGMVGLRRHRSIHAVMDVDRVIGVALCYRGPIGINLSLLENRCELILDRALPAQAAGSVVRALLAAARQEYADLPGGRIPVLVHPDLSRVALACGAREVRRYTQGIWLDAALPAWGAHVAKIYSRRLSQNGG